ncbi:MAG: hypothetical protein HKN23_17750 [Verrucomicrobiales bacterium]|nr:hypothetical protein [Verrucomicrobiales bacterium]
MIFPRTLLTALCGLIFLPVFGQETPAKKEFRKGLLFESTIENPKVFSKVDGAKKTMLVPAFEWEYGVKFFTKESWQKQGIDWEGYRKAAIGIADSIVDSAKMELVRDERKVVDYAILQSDDPFLSSVLLSEKLYMKLKDKLGENMHVVIPERGTIYLFPAEGSKLDGYGPSIVRRFRASKSPVSVEVFLLNSDGYRVIGELSEN